MWIDRLTASPTTHALQLSAQFAEQRQKVLAENLANIDTPDHPTRRLDATAFQAALHEALEGSDRPGAQRLELRGHAQVSTGPDGKLAVRPADEPASNVLFHDGTNARLERLLADVSENALSYEMTMNLLRGRYQGLLRAIRGRVE